MFAAIPYFELGVYNLPVPGVGSLPIDPWATLVCIGFVVGLEVARYRAIKLGLQVRDIVDGAVFIVLSGFFVAHLFTVVFYFPERMLDAEGAFSLYTAFDAIILRVWQGFASTGGFVGAILGAIVFYGLIRKAGAWRHADIICYGFPFGWFFGRLGCGVVHDHIGSPTTFPLAMDFDHGIGPWAAGDPFVSGIRHELGLYEMAYMVPVCLLFLWLGRQDRTPGFFLGMFAVTYAPIRFVLDFLRNADLSHQDARYGGLTPAQYGMIAMFVAGGILLMSLRRRAFEPVPLGGPVAQPAEAEAEA
ncbi:MAG: phosphatidylglycerol:prolipoprotein diacylglycerol transferase [Myxococcota bacterium]|jgi:phosphatidylglycerol:prolipoprotein diacylglycerol transferase